MAAWQLISQRILFGDLKEESQEEGAPNVITAYQDPKTGEVINTWGVQVVEKKYLAPDGHEHSQIITSGSGLHSVVVFALSEDQNVVLVRQYRHGMDAEIIECPAGLMLGEDMAHEELGIQEVLEETGYGEPDKIMQLADPLYISTGKADTYFVPFLATGLRKVAQQKLGSAEDIDVVTMSLVDWLRMIQKGEVIGASSITTTLLALMEIERDQFMQLFE